MSRKRPENHDKLVLKEYNPKQMMLPIDLKSLRKIIFMMLLISGTVMLVVFGTERNALATGAITAVPIVSCAAHEAGVESNNEIPKLGEYGTSLESFIPNGWNLIKKATGDLNNDGLEDIAGVIEYNKPYNKSALEKAPPRILFIALREKNGYRLSIQTEKAILKADQGGVWGDPFESISVNRGSLLIKFYGGSNYRWAYNYRFSYQNASWNLIGYTSNSWYTGTGAGKREDYNLLTGIMIVSTVDKNVVVKEETINRGHNKLVKLQEFSGVFDDKE